jgi:hypothetical protein
MDIDAVDALLDRANDHADREEHHKAIALLKTVGTTGPNWVGLNLGNSYVSGHEKLPIGGH